MTSKRDHERPYVTGNQTRYPSERQRACRAASHVPLVVLEPANAPMPTMDVRLAHPQRFKGLLATRHSRE